MRESFEQSVFEAIDRYSMGISGRNALVCVSGGPDSMALLHFVAVNREKLFAHVTSTTGSEAPKAIRKKLW